MWRVEGGDYQTLRQTHRACVQLLAVNASTVHCFSVNPPANRPGIELVKTAAVSATKSNVRDLRNGIEKGCYRLKLHQVTDI